MAVQNDRGNFLDRVCASARRASASREIIAALLSDDLLHLRPLQLIVERAAELTDAEQAIVLVPVDPDQPSRDVDRLVVSAAAVGSHANGLLGQEVPVNGSTAGEVFRSGEPLITDTFRHPIQAFTDVGKRPAIVMLLRSGHQPLGVMMVARKAGAPPFDDEYFDLVRDFADHAAIALTLATERRHASEQAVLADRERIVCDLNDQVIQRLFIVGMDLQDRWHGPARRHRTPALTTAGGAGGPIRGRIGRRRRRPPAHNLQPATSPGRAAQFRPAHPGRGRAPQ